MKTSQAKDSDQFSARFFILLIFAIGYRAARAPQPGHDSIMPLLSFSLLSV